MSTTLIRGGTVVSATGRVEADVLVDGEKIAALREYITKSQSGEITASATEIKEKTDELQVASLNLFDKMHKARNEQSSGEQQSTEGEKKDENKP